MHSGARLPAHRHRPFRVGLSAVLRVSRGIRDGQAVEVILGDGTRVVGRAEVLDAGVIRVRLPEGAK